MQRLNPENIEADVKTFLRKWVKLLSEGKFDEAVQQLNVLTNADEVCWNAAFLKEVIYGYGDTAGNITIEDPYRTDPAGEKVCFYFYNDGSGFAVEYDLPLNGEWSDLTASFSFKRSGDGFAVYLDGIHVL